METIYESDWINLRAKHLLEKKQFELYRSADRMFTYAMPIQLAITICLAYLVTPLTWIGASGNLQTHVLIALVLGGLVSLVTFAMTRWYSGRAITRYVIAISQMMFSILLIHLTGGRIESHFHIFGSLALLSLYRDWKVLVIASLFVAVDHFARGIWWPMSVFGVINASPFRWVEHSSWIAFCDLFLVLSCFKGNQLASQICYRQADLEQANRSVEQIIWTRTKDLKIANRKLKGEVKTRVRAEREREKLTRKLLQASRQAGMSEVATGVLHSVGNVINSINVSTETILDRLDASRIDRLDDAVEMINLPPQELISFLHDDPKGKQIPSYLRKVTNELKKQHIEFYAEVAAMRNNVAHVSEIVFMQQAYATVGGVTEEFSINELCEDAININNADLLRQDIEIVRDYGDVPTICTERHKVLQILVNLISNGKHAVMQQGCEPKQIRISTRINDASSICVTVEDTGIGISETNLEKIFQHGFTTRKGGHGFGLHCSVLAAQELNGSLEATSDGVGLGAKFMLMVPVSEVPTNSVNAATFITPNYLGHNFEGALQI